MENTFNIGEKIQFMSVTHKGTSVSFNTREGKILEFSKPKGLKACIKSRNGKTTWVKISELRKLSEKSPVNDVFESISKQN